jgi:vacuolar protein sorting-associated protein 1
MAIVSEKINASKPAPPTDNLKTGKLAPGTVNNNKDLDVDLKKDDASFFSSFFSNKNIPKKKPDAVSTMEAVRNSCD